MKVFLGIGSNLKPRKTNISQALESLSKICSIEKVSPVYETAALLLQEAPSEWNQAFLNLVIQIEFSGDPLSLLNHLKAIEKKLGRKDRKKWSPRSIDLDILLCEDQQLSLPELKVPHPEMEKRAFVLDPLKDLLPSFITKARKHKNHAPLWMAIINLTPDSFSDGGLFTDQKIFVNTLLNYEKTGINIIDLGAESTRPGATSLSADEELTRLKPFLKQFFRLYEKKKIKPLMSVDTRHIKTADFCLNLGVDIINDVSGLNSPDMISLLKDSKSAYVLTHSLDVPVKPKNVLNGDPLPVLHNWLEKKLEIFEKNNISLDRIFFDPGIGFGKTELQSLRILKNLKSFEDCPVRLLISHSRKSFMKHFSPQDAELRDLETLGISLQLIHQGVDVLRVHNPEMHIRTFRGWSHVTG